MGRLGKLWPEESELIQLVREAQRGGPGALDPLLARLRPSFVAYFAPTMGRDDAEDAAQMTLLSIVRTLPRIDAERAAGYVLAVASHRRENARRRRATAARRFAPLELAEDVEWPVAARSEEHTSELQSLAYLVCRLLLEKKKKEKKKPNKASR